MEEKKPFTCWKCFEKHEYMKCPAYGYYCSECTKPDHLPNTWAFKGRKKPPDVPRGGSHGDGRCRGSGGNGRGYSKKDQGFL